jgi:hypothetical protein
MARLFEAGNLRFLGGFRATAASEVFTIPFRVVSDAARPTWPSNLILRGGLPTGFEKA